MLSWKFNDNIIFKNKLYLEIYFKKKLEKMFFFSNTKFVKKELLKYDLIKLYEWLNNIKYFNESLIFLKFKVGDIVNLYYNLYSKAFFFQGICIFKKNKSMKNKNSLILLRGKMLKVNVQICVLWYAVKAYLSKLDLYRRSKLIKYKKSKIYYIGNKFKVV